MTKLTKQFFIDNGYIIARQLDDGTWIGIGPLIYTMAIFVGLDESGWEKQYCYDDNVKLIDSYVKLERFEDVPTGWIAKRPKE